MDALNSRNLRRNSHWIVLAVSFVLLAATISLTVFWPSGTLAFGIGESKGSPSAADAAFEGPQQCGQCHEAEYQAWSSTTHAQALFDPIFQTYLQEVEEPGECFACHTTGYNGLTGQFVTAGVTCEACHGPYRAEHPAEAMTIAASEDLCGHCHPSTLFEWEASRHGEIGVTCVDCHEVHTQKTRAAVATNNLCAGCHIQQVQDETHSIHSAASVPCVDCHLARYNENLDAAVSGHAITAHSFTVAVSTCDDCHPKELPR